MAEYGHTGWSGSTDGTPWMQRTLIRLFRFFPMWVGYGIMGLVIPFYMLFSRRAFRASYSFYHDHIGRGPLGSFFGVYSSEFHLGQVVLDRFAMYAGKEFYMDMDGFDLFQNLIAKEGGFMVLSSHVGNYEMAGYTLTSEVKKFFALVFSGETKTVMEGRAKLFGDHNIEMVPVSEDMSHIFTLNNALSGGNIVSVPGDRVFGSTKTVSCNFLGSEASLPAGPFSLAVSRGVPVLSVFVMKTGISRYKTIIRTVGDGNYKDTSRGEIASKLAKNYAGNMEDVVRMYPEQWYNFFDFWKQ